MEGQTLGNTLCDLFICPSSEIHKCYDPKTIGYFAHLNPCFRFRPILIFEFEFEADYRGSASYKYHVQSQRQLNLKERKSTPKIKL